MSAGAWRGRYLAEIDRTPLPSADEERGLAARVPPGDAEARDRMVRANLRLVVDIARRNLTRKIRKVLEGGGRPGLRVNRRRGARGRRPAGTPRRRRSGTPAGG